MLKPGIYAGMLLAFTMSLDDFVVSYFVTGNGVQNISIVVYNMTKRTNPTINALSTLLILAVVIILIVVNVIPAIAKRQHREANEIASKGHGVWKKFAPVLSVILAIAIAGGCVYGFVKEQNRQVLRVFNSGEYMDTNLLTKFEKEYDCEVVYETYDSNESMYTKLLSGAEYDILVPSDYMVERLIKEERIQPVNWDLITNKDNVISNLFENEYDPENKYTVPYYWGTVGILYNKNIVDKADLAQGWEILKNKKYAGNIYMYDSERDSFMVALKVLGYSMNTSNHDELKKAYDWLVDPA